MSRYPAHCWLLIAPLKWLGVRDTTFDLYGDEREHNLAPLISVIINEVAVIENTGSEVWVMTGIGFLLSHTD